MKKFAARLNDTENEKKFEKLSNKLTGILLDKYWINPVPGPINRQTLFSTLLYHRIIPDSEINIAVDSLIKATADGPSGHFSTGIFGTKYILETLSKTGNVNSVFKIVNSISYPGWGYMIHRGATTIWETWKESDNVYSNCHPMFGSVSEWCFKWLAGIRPDPYFPGFKNFIIAPSIPDGLEYVNCSYLSPYGIINSNWKTFGKEKQVFEITIPSRCIAAVRLPVTQQQELTLVEKNGNDSYFPFRDGPSYMIYELGPGEYTITVASRNNN